MRNAFLAFVFLTLTPPAMGAGLLAAIESVDPKGSRSIDPDISFGWLEGAGTPKVRNWSRQQNDRTRAALDSWPGRDKIVARLKDLLKAGALSGLKHVGGRIFYAKREGLENHAVLYVRDAPDYEPFVVVDVNKSDQSGDTSLDWWYPSHDGLLVAYGFSKRGTENSVLKIRQVDASRDLPDRITRTSNASVAWIPDRTGFYYTRYPRPGTVPVGEEHYHRKVFFHEIGTNALKDVEIFGGGMPKESWPEVQTSRNGEFLVVTTFEGRRKSRIFARYLKRNTTDFWEVTEGRDAYFEGKIGGNFLYMRTNDHAPRYRLASVDLRWPKLPWKEVVPQGKHFIIKDFSVAGAKLALEVLERASTRLRIHSLRGKALREIPLPPSGALRVLDGNFYSQNLFFIFESFFSPATLYRYDISFNHNAFFRTADRPLEYRTLKKLDVEEARRPTPIGDPALSVIESIKSPIDLKEYEMKRVTFRSTGKTRVGMFLLKHKRIQRDKNAPVLLISGGGAGESVTPSFDLARLLWLEKGGLLALPNIRGGGAYGTKWQEAGHLKNKQNAIDDLRAAARWLAEEEYSRPGRIGIFGAAHGGMLAAAALTQEPGLFRAAVLDAPLTDMLRFHKSRSGRLWIHEYGEAGDRKQFQTLYKYSPYHAVKNKTAYPAVLFMTGANDRWVDPMHARKLAARLKKATTSGHPILYRLESDGGHGPGKPLVLRIEELADEYGFLMWQLGIKPDEEP